MFTAHLIEFKTRQVELYKQAEHYRLVKSLQKPNQGVSLFINAMGRMLVNSGLQLIASSGVAN